MLIGDRAREAGPYQKSEKVSLFWGGSGCPVHPDRWFEIWNNGGTTIICFYAFIERILQDLGPGVPGRRYCFTMDNLDVHVNGAIQAMIINAGHQIVYRAPYYPVDGAIEYIFNAIQCTLRIDLQEIQTTEDFTNCLRKIITTFPNFDTFFAHIGFFYNINWLVVLYYCFMCSGNRDKGIFMYL